MVPSIHELQDIDFGLITTIKLSRKLKRLGLGLTQFDVNRLECLCNH